MKTFIEKNFSNFTKKKIKNKILINYKNFNFNFKNCVVYGASKEAKIFIKECRKNNIIVDAVVDDITYDVWFEGFAVLKSLETIKKTFTIVVCTQKFGAVINKLKKLGYKYCVPLYLLQVLSPKKFFPHQFYKNWINELYLNKKKYAEAEKIFTEKKSISTWKSLMLFKYNFNIDFLYPEVSFGDDYFPNDLNTKITKKEIFIDGGGWIGDTTDVFLSKYKKYKNIFIYEPGKFAISKLKGKYNKSKKIKIKKAAVGKEKTFVNFYDTKDPSSTEIRKSYQKPYKVKVLPIDDLGLKNENITIKLNVEGSEKNALLGAKRTIRTNNTNLIVCLNHRPSDIVDLIKHVRSLGKKFKYYLRSHDYGITQLVLYAIDQERNSKRLNKYQ